MVTSMYDQGSGYKPVKQRPEDDPDNPESKGFNEGQQQTPSFAEMQKNGQARPAPPETTSQPQMPPEGMTAYTGAPMQSMPGQAPPQIATNPQVGGAPTPDNPNGGGSGFEQQLRDQYNNYKGSTPFQVPQIGQNPFTSQFQAQGFTGQSFQPQQFSDPNQGSGFQSALQASIMGGLQNPSRYDDSLVQSMFDRLGGQIDDQYNGMDQDLRSSIASRGLGSIGDSSIGTADQRFNNLQRRSAKTDLANNLLQQMAATRGSDRAQAQSAGMQFGQNQFGNALQGAGFNNNAGQQGYQNAISQQDFNNQAGQQNFGNSLNAWSANQPIAQQNFQNQLAGFQANQGANQQDFQQKQALLQNLLGYGQQSFQNQLATTQQNQNADAQYRAWLQSILGG